MKSIVFKDSNTNKLYWCIANMGNDCSTDMNVYIETSPFKEMDESVRVSSNLLLVEQPEGVSMNTHIYTENGFVVRPPATEPTTVTPSNSAVPTVL